MPRLAINGVRFHQFRAYEDNSTPVRYVGSRFMAALASG
jgi:hypothetical protein